MQKFASDPISPPCLIILETKALFRYTNTIDIQFAIFHFLRIKRQVEQAYYALTKKVFLDR